MEVTLWEIAIFQGQKATAGLEYRFLDFAKKPSNIMHALSTEPLYSGQAEKVSVDI
jgi:hypothetical protein